LFFASTNPNQLTRESNVGPILVRVYRFVRTNPAYALKTFNSCVKFGCGFVSCATPEIAKPSDLHDDSDKSGSRERQNSCFRAFA
jgi:hypothetical protein